MQDDAHSSVTKEGREEKFTMRGPLWPLSAAVHAQNCRKFGGKFVLAALPAQTKGAKLFAGGSAGGRTSEAAFSLVKEKLLPLGKVFRWYACRLGGRAAPAFIFIVRFSACEIRGTKLLELCARAAA